MERKYKTLELRERLDNTLALPDLVDEEAIKSLVKDQLLRSSFGNGVDAEKVVEKRAREVSNFLGMLRSASGNKQKEAKTNGPSYNEWKIKQDTDQLRVMYREGPHGTPFHTLLTEGHADGPIDVYVSHGSQLCIKNGGHSTTFQLSKLPIPPACRKFALGRKFL